MAKQALRRNVAREILEGLRELKRGETGRVINVPSVAEIRERTGLSQARFATLLGVSVRTLQDWEQGRRAPSGAARTLLMWRHRLYSAKRFAMAPQGMGLPGSLRRTHARCSTSRDEPDPSTAQRCAVRTNGISLRLEVR
jgi:putative transcriptional regulator